MTLNAEERPDERPDRRNAHEEQDDPGDAGLVRIGAQEATEDRDQYRDEDERRPSFSSAFFRSVTLSSYHPRGLPDIQFSAGVKWSQLQIPSRASDWLPGQESNLRRLS